MLAVQFIHIFVLDLFFLLNLNQPFFDHNISIQIQCMYYNFLRVNILVESLYSSLNLINLICIILKLLSLQTISSSFWQRTKQFSGFELENSTLTCSLEVLPLARPRSFSYFCLSAIVFSSKEKSNFNLRI